LRPAFATLLSAALRPAFATLLPGALRSATLPSKASTTNREAGTWVNTSLWPSFSTKAALLSASLRTTHAGAEAFYFSFIQKTVLIFINPIKKAGHLLGNLRFADFAILVFIEHHRVKSSTLQRTTFSAALGPTLTAETSLWSASLPTSKASIWRWAHAGPKARISGHRGG